jgi:hypothetical protein
MPPIATAAGWSHPDLFSFWLAGGLALFVVAVRRLRSAPWLVGAAVFLALASVAVVSTQFDLVGWHGFMHGAPMLRILDGGPVPPEDPLFAGGTLRYPWAEHWLMARLALATGLNPHFLTIGIEVFLFAGFLACGAWLASMVTRDREVIALSVLLSAFGVSVFHGGVLQDALLRAFPWLSMESRVVPLDKFGSITGMPMGYVAMALASCCGVRLACREGSVRVLAAVVAACTLIAALIHPLSWTGILAFEGVVGLVLVASRRRDDLERALWLGAAVALPSLVVLPYLRSIGASESSDGWSGLTSPEALLAAKSIDLAIFFLPLLLLAYFCRDRLAGLLEDGNRALRLLVLVILAMAAAHLVVRFPGRNEYKFLLFAAPSAAVVIALCLREVLDRHLLAGLAVLGLLLLPGARDLGFRPWFVVTDPCRADGFYLRANDPAADQLYQWIAANTPGDAVFLAADVRIPPLARRGLYVAVEQPWRGRDGWGLPRNQLLQWHIRRPDAVMYRRQHLATLVLDANWLVEPAASLIARIQADVPGRPLFVHDGNPDAVARLDRTPGFQLLFRNAAGSIYAAGR